MRDQLGPDVEVGRALAELRAGVAGTINRPVASAVRAHAEHRVRVRRTVSAVAVAVAVVAVAATGVVLTRGTAQPPVFPPAATPTGIMPGTPDPSSTATRRPTSAPSGSASPPPQAADPMTKVDWTTAEITIPEEPGCPLGAVQLRLDAGNGFAYGPTSYPRVSINHATVGYGDVTGDGRMEAILDAGCQADAENSGDGKGRLLVVTRQPNGTLVGLGWAGVPGAIFAESWASGGTLFTDMHPWHQDWGYRLGAVRAYRLSGGTFTEVETTTDYPALVLSKLAEGPEVDLTAVADRLGCPGTVLRFDPQGRASGAGTTWDLGQPEAPDMSPHLADLDGNGTRRMLVVMTCGRPADGVGGVSSLVVLDRAGDGFRAVDALRPPAGMSLGGWRYAAGALTLSLAPDGGGEVSERRYRWTDSRFQE